LAAKKRRLTLENFELGHLLHDVARLRRTVVDKALKPLGVTRSQWWVLMNMNSFCKEELMQTELAAVMDIGKVALGGMLDRLEANGYIQRVVDPHDRRARLLSLTEKGAALIVHIEHRYSALNRIMLRGFDMADIASMEKLLLQLKERLIEMDRNMAPLDFEEEAGPLY
jgi:MarR family transcriptional regulator for hemolysin